MNVSIPFEHDANRDHFFGIALEIVNAGIPAGAHVPTADQMMLVSKVTEALCAAWQAGFDASIADDDPFFECVDEVYEEGDILRLSHTTWDGAGEYEIVSVRSNSHAMTTTYTVKNTKFDDETFEVVHGDPAWHVERVSGCTDADVQ